MSSLWTPGGEHPVDRDQPGTPPPAGEETEAIPPTGGVEELLASLPPEQRAQLEALSPEEREEALAMAQEMAMVRQQIKESDASVVIANHLMGIYELAAIHLSDEDPDLEAAQLAIDSLAAVLDNVTGRLGEHEETLVNARAQIQMAFVQIRTMKEGG
ncbi:MAG: hypothetical protein GY745_06075 [Actinomycetia bacterium]|nr:hypothetical protein [Actinomycetes bacterium]MCP3911873.1 hypothetical protein [Actinomycetes bacterium]MCP4084603.1 hypothetical protein [Actinomycetes bacterium]